MKKTRNGSHNGMWLKNNRFRHFLRPLVSVMMIMLTLITVIDAFLSNKAFANAEFTSDTGTSMTYGTYAGSDNRAYIQ